MIVAAAKQRRSAEPSRIASRHRDGDEESVRRLAAAVAAWHWNSYDAELPGQDTVEEDLLDVLAHGRARHAVHRA